MAKDAAKDAGKDDDLTPEERAALKQAKATHGVSDAELEGLSAEERAAIEEADDDTEGLREIAAEGEEGAEAAAKKKAKGPGEEEEEDDGEDAKGKKKAAPAEDEEEGEEEGAAAKDKKAPAKADADHKEGEKEPAKAGADDADDEYADVQRSPRMPRLAVTPVEKFDEQMKALDAEYDAAEAKYKEGDLDVTALIAKERELNAKRFALREANSKATQNAEINDQYGRAEWMGDVQNFMAAVKAKEDIDYTKRALNVAFDDALKQLAAVKENEDKDEAWYLREAHKMVKKDLGLVAKPATGEDKGGKKTEGRKPKLALVHDLGKIPDAGDVEGDESPEGDAEFAYLDKLSGLDLEDAIARMSDEKQERYARAR